MKVVVAIGGNALVDPEGSGDIHEQFRLSRAMARPLADLVQSGCQLTITHGNGPQVGSVMRRVELSSDEVYPIDLGLAVGNTQAGMGYMISQTLRNELHGRGIDRTCSAIVTTVVIPADSPEFDKPTKPIGWFMDEATAIKHRDRDGWDIVEDAGRGYRRVVPSPKPIRIVQIATIKKLVEAGELIVAGGGGGIPVIENETGEYHGVEAVVDKDWTSAMLAAEVEADVLVLVTGVESVFINFGTPQQETLKRVGLERIKALVADNQFPAGSMRPKIEAAARFLEVRNDPSARAVITDLHHVPAALDGQAGTTLTL